MDEPIQQYKHLGLTYSLMHVPGAYSVCVATVVDKNDRNHITGDSNNNVSDSALIQGF